MNKHELLKQRALSKPSVKTAYDALGEEFDLLQQMLLARQAVHKTQAEVAQKMGTTTSVIGRLETGGGAKQHSPSLATLKKYAEAVGCHLIIKLVPQQKSN